MVVCLASKHQATLVFTATVSPVRGHFMVRVQVFKLCPLLWKVIGIDLPTPETASGGLLPAQLWPTLKITTIGAGIPTAQSCTTAFNYVYNLLLFATQPLLAVDMEPVAELLASALVVGQVPTVTIVQLGGLGAVATNFAVTLRALKVSSGTRAIVSVLCIPTASALAGILQTFLAIIPTAKAVRGRCSGATASLLLPSLLRDISIESVTLGTANGDRPLALCSRARPATTTGAGLPTAL